VSATPAGAVQVKETAEKVSHLVKISAIGETARERNNYATFNPQTSH
jgi:hypothetical protein